MACDCSGNSDSNSNSVDIHVVTRPRRMVVTALAYEMDAVAWREGPWQLGSEPGPQWLVAAHSEAAAAAQHLRVLLQQSELSPWDTRPLSESKEAVRSGCISRLTFAAVLQQESARIMAAAAAGDSAEGLDSDEVLDAAGAATGTGHSSARSSGANLLRRSGSRLVSTINKGRAKVLPFVGSSSSSNNNNNTISSAAVQPISTSPPAPALLQRSATAGVNTGTVNKGSSGATPSRPARYEDVAVSTTSSSLRDRGVRSASSSPRTTARVGKAHSISDLSSSGSPQRHTGSDALPLPAEKASDSELAAYARFLLLARHL
jgi:hypothetical protein